MYKYSRQNYVWSVLWFYQPKHTYYINLYVYCNGHGVLFHYSKLTL